jgi:hypothetical protein
VHHLVEGDRADGEANGQDQARVDQSSRGGPASRRRRWGGVALGACGLAIVAYAVVGRRAAEPRRDEPLQATRLTAYAGSESAPSLSPEGSQVAFSWNGSTPGNHDIYVWEAHRARYFERAWSVPGSSSSPPSGSSAPSSSRC